MQNIIKKSNWHKTNPDLACIARQFLGWVCKAIKVGEGKKTARRLGGHRESFSFSRGRSRAFAASPLSIAFDKMAMLRYLI